MSLYIIIQKIKQNKSLNCQRRVKFEKGETGSG